MSQRDAFLDKLSAAIRDRTFVKLTLSRPCGEDPTLRNLYGRLVELREGIRMQLTWRYGTRDVVKNVALDAVGDVLEEQIGVEFERAHLFTTGADWQLRCDANGRTSLKAKRPAFTKPVSLEHDRPKIRQLSGSPFFGPLGITAGDGNIRPSAVDKVRQMERFVEILGHVLNDSPLAEAKKVRVCDIGAGKGYLTFAMCEMFRRNEVEAEVIGVEQREDLVEFTNRVAQDLGYRELNFVQGLAEDFQPQGEIDILIALHACDTATDDALATGVRSGASVILASPCCHKEVRRQMKAPQVLRDVLRHGILAERQAEIVTDAIRALVLELHGYDTDVFEFISHEHTGKNLMIGAVKRERPGNTDAVRARLQELLAFFGIEKQRLVELLPRQ